MKNHRIALTTLLVVAGTLAAFKGARADIASDRAAAILVFPRVIVSSLVVDSTTIVVESADTMIQISNTTNDLVSLHCFYVNANSHCTISGTLCDNERGPVGCPLDADLCLPQWSETDFHVDITAQQPLAWRASTGLAGDEFPLDGVALRGPTGQSNAGSAVPPVNVDRIDLAPDVSFSGFQGELKCIVVDASGRAIPRNAVKGEATIVTQFDIASGAVQEQVPQAEKYNAIGIQAIDGDANGDGVLELGGGANEYNGCPNVLIVNHFFDSETVGGLSALDQVPSDIGSLQAAQQTEPLFTLSELTLVPCNQDFRLQIPGRTVAQFLVFNEFEQRFSTSRTVDCFFRHFLSSIDTQDPRRSIFFASVAGTTVGQTRIRGVSGGLLGVISETTTAGEFFLPFAGADDAANLHFQGDREQPDRIVLP